MEMSTYPGCLISAILLWRICLTCTIDVPCGNEVRKIINSRPEYFLAHSLTHSEDCGVGETQRLNHFRLHKSSISLQSHFLLPDPHVFSVMPTPRSFFESRIENNFLSLPCSKSPSLALSTIDPSSASDIFRKLIGSTQPLVLSNVTSKSLSGERLLKKSQTPFRGLASLLSASSSSASSASKGPLAPQIRGFDSEPTVNMA